MNDKLLNLLGLARRANKLALGNDMVLKAIADGSAELIVFACDTSEKTKKNILNAVGKQNIINLPFNMTELSLAIGKRCGVVSVNDKGFAAKAEEYVSEANKNFEVGGTVNGTKKGHEA